MNKDRLTEISEPCRHEAQDKYEVPDGCCGACLFAEVKRLREALGRMECSHDCRYLPQEWVPGIQHSAGCSVAIAHAALSAMGEP